MVVRIFAFNFLILDLLFSLIQCQKAIPEFHACLWESCFNVSWAFFSLFCCLRMRRGACGDRSISWGCGKWCWEDQASDISSAQLFRNPYCCQNPSVPSVCILWSTGSSRQSQPLHWLQGRADRLILSFWEFFLCVEKEYKRGSCPQDRLSPLGFCFLLFSSYSHYANCFVYRGRWFVSGNHDYLPFTLKLSFYLGKIKWWDLAVYFLPVKWLEQVTSTLGFQIFFQACACFRGLVSSNGRRGGYVLGFAFPIYFLLNVWKTGLRHEPHECIHPLRFSLFLSAFLPPS